MKPHLGNSKTGLIGEAAAGEGGGGGGGVSALVQTYGRPLIYDTCVNCWGVNLLKCKCAILALTLYSS